MMSLNISPFESRSLQIDIIKCIKRVNASLFYTKRNKKKNKQGSTIISVTSNFELDIRRKVNKGK